LSGYAIDMHLRIGVSFKRKCPILDKFLYHSTESLWFSRDITRKALIAKDSKITELEHRIKTLEAELDTERAIISYLRSEKAGEEPD
jgi:hypothetical protein